jgi:AcrR family transcriptional regulator
LRPSTRDRLIDAATDLFFRHGYHAVGLDRILEAVGITKTAFYKHFESKDALILAALERRDRHDIDELLTYIRDRAPLGHKAQLLALFDMLCDWFSDESFRGCMFMAAAIEFPLPHDPIHIMAESHGAHLHGALANVARDAGVEIPDALAGQLMLVVGGALTARHVSLDRTAAETARIAAEALIDRHLQPATVAA